MTADGVQELGGLRRCPHRDRRADPGAPPLGDPRRGAPTPPFDERTVAELTARHPVQAAGAALLTCPSPTGKFCSAGYQPRPGGELTREAVIRAYPAAPSRIAVVAIPVSATARSTSIPVRET